MKVTLIGIKRDYAVCEQADRTIINIKKDKPPVKAKECDILLIEEKMSEPIMERPLKIKNFEMLLYEL
jgi:hypothetical protein